MEIAIEIPDSIIDVCKEQNMVKSKTEFLRLVKQGGVSIMVEQAVVKIGKRKFIRLIWS